MEVSFERISSKFASEDNFLSRLYDSVIARKGMTLEMITLFHILVLLRSILNKLSLVA